MYPNTFLFILLATQTSENYNAHQINSLLGLINHGPNKNKNYASTCINELQAQDYITKKTINAILDSSGKVIERAYTTLSFNDRTLNLDIVDLHKKTLLGILELKKTDANKVKRSIEMILASPSIISSSGSYIKFDKSKLKYNYVNESISFFCDNLYHLFVTSYSKTLFEIMNFSLSKTKEELNREFIYTVNDSLKYFIGMVENLQAMDNNINLSLSKAQSIIESKLLTTDYSCVPSSLITMFVNRLNIVKSTKKYKLINHFIEKFDNAINIIDNVRTVKNGNDTQKISWNAINELLISASRMSRFSYKYFHKSELTPFGKLLMNDVDSFGYNIKNCFKQITDNPFIKEIRTLYKESSSLIIPKAKEVNCIGKMIIPKANTNQERRKILRHYESGLVNIVSSKITAQYSVINEYDIKLDCENTFEYTKNTIKCLLGSN